MAIKQLSILVDNKQGTLAQTVSLLAEKGIDLRSICVADTEDYGIVRLITDQPQAALEVLFEQGFTAKLTDVIACSCPDEPGGLARVLNVLNENGINMEYMYSIINNVADQAYMVIRVRDNESAEKVLRENGVRVFGEEEI
ncbi:MAG: ACT domain-containing protein [Lachnospiraceae bacterium]|nr:ACT domain-containing protein [Lachnospiraceae bacterium]MBR3036890.1 ACT domain-containing protein [Lachnospiraceae bacterium]